MQLSLSSRSEFLSSPLRSLPEAVVETTTVWNLVYSVRTDIKKKKKKKSVCSPKHMLGRLAG